MSFFVSKGQPGENRKEAPEPVDERITTAEIGQVLYVACHFGTLKGRLEGQFPFGLVLSGVDIWQGDEPGDKGQVIDGKVEIPYGGINFIQIVPA